jgi:hypothetical protein
MATLATSQQQIQKPVIRYSIIFTEVCIGALYVGMDFPYTVQQYAQLSMPVLAPFVTTGVETIQGFMLRLAANPLLQLDKLMAILFLQLGIYVGLMLLITIRSAVVPIELVNGTATKRWLPHMVIMPMITGLVAGFFGIHVFAWLAPLLIIVIQLLFSVISWISWLFGVIASTIINSFLWIILGIWGIFGWWLLLLLVAGIAGVSVVAWLLISYGPSIARFIGEILTALRNWFAQVIWPVIYAIGAWIFWFIFFILKLVLGVWVLSMLGRLLLDQFRSSATSSDGPKGTFLGAFGIGSAFTLILLGTAYQPVFARQVDQGWILLWQWLLGNIGDVGSNSLGITQWSITTIYLAATPAWLQEICTQYLSSRSTPPLFEILAAILILIISCLLACTQFVKKSVDVDRQLVVFFNREIMKAIGLFFVAVVMLFLQGVDDNQN